MDVTSTTSFLNYVIKYVYIILLDNWAFLYAQKLALKMEVPLHVCFCLVPKFLDASYRQFSFMLKGLREVEQVRYVI